MQDDFLSDIIPTCGGGKNNIKFGEWKRRYNKNYPVCYLLFFLKFVLGCLDT